jgi:hypothetical protein
MTATISERASATVKPGLRPGQLVTEEQVHWAMEQLARTPVPLGEAVRLEKKSESEMKRHEALGFLGAEGSIDFRRSKARTSPEYLASSDAYATACGEKARIYSIREAASAIIEIYRTQSATIRHATKL